MTVPNMEVHLTLKRTCSCSLIMSRSWWWSTLFCKGL